jgi:hypothetical protein
VLKNGALQSGLRFFRRLQAENIEKRTGKRQQHPQDIGNIFSMISADASFTSFSRKMHSYEKAGYIIPIRGRKAVVSDHAAARRG